MGRNYDASAPRTTQVVLVCCKIYRRLHPTRTAGQPIREEHPLSAARSWRAEEEDGAGMVIVMSCFSQSLAMAHRCVGHHADASRDARPRLPHCTDDLLRCQLPVGRHAQLCVAKNLSKSLMPTQTVRGLYGDEKKEGMSKKLLTHPLIVVSYSDSLISVNPNSFR